MKIQWTIKNLFKNYKVLLIILGLEYVFQFTQIKKYSLPQIIMKIHETFMLWGNDLSLVSNLLPLLFQTLTYLILIICVFSGVLFLCKKVIHHETYNMGDFVYGIENNWKKVFVTGVLFIFTFGILTEVTQLLVAKLNYSDDMKFIYLKSSISASLRLFYTSLVVYGSIVLIENEFKIKNVFKSVAKFIFSKEALKLYIIMLMLGILSQSITILKSNYTFSLSDGGNLFSVIDTLSSRSYPRWLQCLEWFMNTIITSFTLLYTSLVFYCNSHKNEFEKNK